MTRSLLRSQRVIESRLLHLEQKLNDELSFRDRRLRFTKRVMRAGPITWLLRNEKVEATGGDLPQGIAAELAAAANDDSILYFGYSEEWQPARTGGQIEFVSSNLRFVIAGVEEMPDLRFRLEWAGAKTEGGMIAYPGLGAAHPHWQFDLDAGWIELLLRTGEGTDVRAVEIDLEPLVEEVDLTTEDDGPAPVVPPTRRVSATLAGFHRLHLPARTMWHDLVCVMPDVATPQQHTPEHEDQIDRWVISALRYLRSEFGAYM